MQFFKLDLTISVKRTESYSVTDRFIIHVLCIQCHWKVDLEGIEVVFYKVWTEHTSGDKKLIKGWNLQSTVTYSLIYIYTYGPLVLGCYWKQLGIRGLSQEHLGMLKDWWKIAPAPEPRPFVVEKKIIEKLFNL